MDQTDEEANGEFQDGVGDDDTGIGHSDDAGLVGTTREVVFRILRYNDAMGPITMASDLKDDLDLDSLDIVQVVVDIEDELSIEIDVRNLWGIHTVQELIEEVENSR